jgi:hypothetical protein
MREAARATQGFRLAHFGGDPRLAYPMLRDWHVAHRERSARAMKRWTALVAAWLLAVTLVTPAWARTVRIETTVPLADHSEETLNRAMKQAVEKSVQGATP